MADDPIISPPPPPSHLSPRPPYEHEFESAAAANAPGWRWDPQLKAYEWWDGAHCTTRALWNGSSWSYVYFRPSPVLAPPKRKWPWPWITGISIAVVAGLVLVGVLHDAVLTHDLLDADFEAGPDPFVVDENAEYALDVVDNEYRISAKIGNPATPALSHAYLARTAYAFTAEATVIEVPDGGVGIGCVPESHSALDGGFLFAVVDGKGILVDAETGEGFDDGEPMTLESGQRIGIRCASEFAAMDGTVQGLIDGKVVLERSNGDSAGFDKLVLMFVPGHESDSAVFDDVIANVP